MEDRTLSARLLARKSEKKSISRRLVEQELDKIFLTLKGKQLLDMGAKDERYSDLFKNFDYVSLDIKPKVKDGRMIQGDGHHLPFRDNSFDNAISIQVIEHTTWPWIIFQELARVLKHNGKLVISWPWLYVFTHDDYWRIHSDSMKWLAEKNQMEIEYLAPIGGLLTNMCMQLMHLISAKIKQPSFFLKSVDNILFKIALKDNNHSTKKHATGFVAVMKKL